MDRDREREAAREKAPIPTAARSPPRRVATVLVVGARIDRADVVSRCEGIGARLRDRDVGIVACDVTALEAPDATTIESLCLLLLSARRVGSRVWLRGASGELRDLLSLFGLRQALPCAETSGREPAGKPEEREQAIGVEEERDAVDPPA